MKLKTSPDGMPRRLRLETHLKGRSVIIRPQVPILKQEALNPSQSLPESHERRMRRLSLLNEFLTQAFSPNTISRQFEKSAKSIGRTGAST